MSSLEEISLIEFINIRQPGNVLRDIAERALCDLRRQSIRVYFEKKKKSVNLPVTCLDVINGVIFPSIKYSAGMIGKTYGSVKWDIQRGKFEFGIIPLRML